jgi:hypothetical protein
VPRNAARTATALSLAALLAGAALPAQAKSPHSEQRGSKKPIGEIVSFDEATSTLIVDLADGEDLTATVDADVQVKIEHRGRHHRSKGHGNPSEGSLEDLTAGALVLRIKTDDDEITKIRLRPAPAEAPAAEGDDGDDSTLPAEDGDDAEEIEGDSGDAAPGDESPGDDVEGPDDSDTPDDSTDTPDDNVDTPDDGE